MGGQRGEPVEHVGAWDAGAEDEFGLVWACDLDCPHPEHNDDPAPQTGSSKSEPNLVRQEHPNGCGIACIAMVAGLGYGEVRDTLSEFLPRERDYGEEGIHHGITEWFLGRLGYAWRTLYAGHLHDPWPPEPFAPVHIAQVRQPSGNTHYVVVTDDGTVLDPLDGERKRLALWDVPDGKFSGVNNVMGIWPVGGRQSGSEGPQA